MTMPNLKMTETRIALLRAIADEKVWEDWYTDEPGEIRYHEYAGRRTRVTGKVRVMKLDGLCETDPADGDLHIRRIRLTKAGAKTLAELGEE
jgi:hypothetical protein